MTINLLGRNKIFGLGDEEIDDAEKIEIPIHAFDLIVADECHRGYASTELAVWRQTLDHFDAIKIGLTATPAAHTTAYFKNVVYRYEYERAVREGYLVDYDVVAVKSNVRACKEYSSRKGKQSASSIPTAGRKSSILWKSKVFEERKIEVLAPRSVKNISAGIAVGKSRR